MTVITTRQTFLISLFLHVLGVIVLCLFGYTASRIVINPPASTASVRSYLYPMTMSQPKPQKVIHNQADIILKPKDKVKKMKTPSPQKIFSVKQAVQSSEVTASSIHQADLLSRLHAAIQAAQNYPSSALQMGRFGKAKIEFILQPSGEVEAIRLLQTSGTQSLDEAALEAVHAISPFLTAKEYLKEAKKFAIDVIFEI